MTTVDIDFGFGDAKRKVYPKTIFDMLSKLDYTERHSRMDRIYPVVLCKGGRIPIDFVTFPAVEEEIVERLVGKQISINKIDKFDFLLKHRIPIEVKDKDKGIACRINCPKPSAFLFHKGATFIGREDEQKQAKDLHYIYFILRYAPEPETILKETNEYNKEGYFRSVSENLEEFFATKSSQGCLMVEKENGPDEYVDDLRQDIFERFGKLRQSLKNN